MTLARSARRQNLTDRWISDSREYLVDLGQVSGDSYLVQFAAQLHRPSFSLRSTIQDSLAMAEVDVSWREIVQTSLMLPADFDGTQLFDPIFSMPDGGVGYYWARSHLDRGEDVGPCGFARFGKIEDCRITIAAAPEPPAIGLLVPGSLLLELTLGSRKSTFRLRRTVMSAVDQLTISWRQIRNRQQWVDTVENPVFLKRYESSAKFGARECSQTQIDAAFFF